MNSQRNQCFSDFKNENNIIENREYYHGSEKKELSMSQCTILDAWGWCTGMTQRDGTGKEEGGGFRMGNTCIPVVDSC